MTVEDALSRRTRSLLLDAQAAIECAPIVAALLASELGRDNDWQQQQTLSFGELAKGYLPDPEKSLNAIP
jgi:glycerol-3-phosphate dehydrogenase